MGELKRESLFNKTEFLLYDLLQEIRLISQKLDGLKQKETVQEVEIAEIQEVNVEEPIEEPIKLVEETVKPVKEPAKKKPVSKKRKTIKKKTKPVKRS